MDVRYNFMATDELFHVLQSEFSDLILLHFTSGKWCLHTDYAEHGFRGDTPRECCLFALLHFIAVRESAKFN